MSDSSIDNESFYSCRVEMGLKFEGMLLAVWFGLD